MNDTTPEIEKWREKEYSFFSHVKCELFPCHDTQDKENFNCLFCYCPLYYLGSECGGNFAYTSSGVKNCINCTLPHERDNYGYVTDQLKEIVRKIKQESSDSG